MQEYVATILGLAGCAGAVALLTNASKYRFTKQQLENGPDMARVFAYKEPDDALEACMFDFGRLLAIRQYERRQSDILMRNAAIPHRFPKL